MSALQAQRPDVAHFWIPGYSGFGRYLVQYVWSGYRDVVDVDFLPQNVTNVYGVPSNTTRWRRIDHCLFNNPRSIFDFTEVLSDADYCLNKCSSRTATSCWGVNVVPIMAPDTAYIFTQPSDANWLYPSIYGTDIYVPWNYTVLNTTRGQFLANPSPNKYMCFSVMPADFTDTTDEYVVSKDPDDPVFYSTCYYRYRGNVFPGYTDSVDPTITPGPWRFGLHCLDCVSQATNEVPDIVPVWKVVDKCINCDLEPVNPLIPTPPVGVVVENGVRCDGLAGSWSRLNHHNCSTNSSCSIQLVPIGRTTSTNLTLSECYELIARNPNCSNTFMWQYNSSISRCYCYPNLPCCSTCSRRADVATAVYEITSTPDPNCLTGVFAADNSTCCSGSCGAGKCLPSTGVAVPNGFCCSTCITRPCSLFAPPCKKY